MKCRQRQGFIPALADAINDFPGAVIMVSHDRYLIEMCADRLWLVANGKVTPYDGDIEDYRREVLTVRSHKDDDGERTRPAPRASDSALPKSPDRGRKPAQKLADVLIGGYPGESGRTMIVK